MHIYLVKKTRGGLSGGNSRRYWQLKPEAPHELLPSVIAVQAKPQKKELKLLILQMPTNGTSHTFAKKQHSRWNISENKFWPSVRRVVMPGDRNLICSCAPIEAYMEN